MRSVKFGSKHAHTLVYDDGTCLLVSYATPVAAYIPGEGLLVTERRHSTTTSCQISYWCGRSQHPRTRQGLHDLVPGLPADLPYRRVPQEAIDALAERRGTA